MSTKVCCRCGVEKPISDFRKYYNNRKGHYTYCKVCEKLEMRRKYLVGLPSLRGDQLSELDAINTLYDVRAAHGLRDPRVDASSGAGVRSIVDEEMKRYGQKEDPVN